MKLVVTGGSGKVGGAVIARALAEGHEVLSVDRAPLEVQDGAESVVLEMSDYEGLVDAFRGADALVHMAAIPNPTLAPDTVVHNSNVVGSYNALRAAAEVGIRRICQGSSINAIGLAYSQVQQFDYFPIDEDHASYVEDPYSLSKRICELQGEAIARRFPGTSIASFRFHWVIADRQMAVDRYGLETEAGRRELWAYTLLDEAARACLLAVETDLGGHEAFHIIAPDTSLAVPTRVALDRYFPDIPRRAAFEGRESLFSSAKAGRLLGWHHRGSTAV